MKIEGKNSVLQALEANTTINKFYAQNNLNDATSNKIIKMAKDKNVKINFVDKTAIDKVAITEKHQGFVCEIVDFEYATVEDILQKAEKENQDPFIVVLDGIEDPHNLGAIIRVCECAGVHGVIIAERRCCQITDTVLKTSAGAALNFLVARVVNIAQTLEKLKQKNIWTYALELGGENLFSTNFSGGCVLVVGSEGFGVSPLVKKTCDNVVTLPQLGKVNSLNASVATGVAVYQILNSKRMC